MSEHNISPANKLSIHNNLGNPDAILISRAASTDSMSIKFLPNGALSPSNTAFYQGVQASSNNYSINTWDGTTWYEPLTVTPTNRVGVGVTGPTAGLHLKAGTATANTAPLKFTSGTLLTTPEAGAIEFLTDAYYGTITTGGALISQLLLFSEELLQPKTSPSKPPPASELQAPICISW
ncbi:MAG: Tail Collar domain protein [Candidatus Nomurabacteria bacterium GW2011_GWB1_36_6]|nr:MAG: Tail Collar domain protein [Candidatus Nomurabacteria bacterium GW2011_GWB1_36_6]